MSTLHGRSILIVEDEYLIAVETARTLIARGAHVIGPVARIGEALALIDQSTSLDGAVLDINLRGSKVYPLADRLRKRGVPFVFATGYDLAAEGGIHPDVARLEKPINPDQIARLLFP